MQEFWTLFNMAWESMKYPITIWGFTFSVWGLVLFSLVGGVIAWFIASIFNAGGGE